jgi:hypothetical protein
MASRRRNPNPSSNEASMRGLPSKEERRRLGMIEGNPLAQQESTSGGPPRRYTPASMNRPGRYAGMEMANEAETKRIGTKMKQTINSPFTGGSTYRNK